MAISSGVSPHLAWLEVNGETFPIQDGSASQCKNKSGSFSAEIPMSYPGAYETFATLGENDTKVWVLSRGKRRALFSGEIDSIDLDFVRTRIHVAGRDKSAKLHGVKTSEQWRNKKGSEIAAELAARVGLAVSLDQSLLFAGKMLQQDFVRLTDGISFAAAIHHLASFDGARWWVTPDGVFHYKSKNDPSAIYTLNYVPPSDMTPMAADFLDLRIRRNVQAGKNVKVTVKSWHPRHKRTYTGEAKIGGNGGTVEYHYHIPNLTQSHADQHAKARAHHHARHACSLHASCVGDPDIDIAMALRLTGTLYYDRDYEMDAINHRFGMAGHRMTISAKLPGEKSS